MSGETRILLHLDDVGVSRGSVEAWKALRTNGVVRSASAMVPCPWYPAARDDYLANPDQDLGIHITLTSEWSAYRWRPMLGSVAGLCDDDGFFHKRPETVAAADPNAVADEIAAQIERMLIDGIKPTHMDAHMGAAYLQPFIHALMDASDRYNIPVMLARDFSQLFDIVRLGKMDLGYLNEITKELELRGSPVLDKFLIGYCADNMKVGDHYARIIAGAGPGTHWLAMHANFADDTAAYAPNMVTPRLKEAEFFGAPESREAFHKAGVRCINWPELQN